MHGDVGLRGIIMFNAQGLLAVFIGLAGVETSLSCSNVILRSITIEGGPAPEIGTELVRPYTVIPHNERATLLTLQDELV
jgi:hypothetical protein